MRRWLVMSILAERYAGLSETAFNMDVKGISGDFERFFEDIEKGGLSAAFWGVTLVRRLEKATANNPFLNIFFAIQVKEGHRGFLSSDVRVQYLIVGPG